MKSYERKLVNRLLNKNKLNVKDYFMNEVQIKTELELEQWLKENCYSMNNYSINGNIIYEGCGLEKNGSLYHWFYTERGEKRILEYFATEKEAVQFALEKIKSDKHAIRNYIGMFKSESEIENIKSELEKRNVEYWTDKIPYNGINDLRTRFFVIGCGIKKVQDLIIK